MKHRPITLSLVLAAATFGVAAHAGTAEVSWINPQRFADIGVSQGEDRNNMRTLANYLQVLAQRTLPRDQVLKVEVLDVDLAGTVGFSRRGSAVRVVHDRADYPRITLRYSLADARGRVIRTAEESIVDQDFTRGIDGAHDWSDLYYEKHMLRNWFRARFGDEQRASR